MPEDSFQGPAAIGPKRAMLIATGLYEAQKIGVGDVVALDGKSRNADNALAALRCPSQMFPGSICRGREWLRLREFRQGPV